MPFPGRAIPDIRLSASYGQVLPARYRARLAARKSFRQRRPQVIAGFIPEPTNGGLGLRKLHRSNGDEESG